MRKSIIVSIVIFLMIFSCSCSDKGKSKDIIKETSSSYKKEESTENIAKDIVYQIIIGEENYNLDGLISTQNLKGLDEKELSILRNAIYAKYGYRFKSSKFTKYFSQIKWYQPKFEDVSNMLTEIDIKNIENIVEIEKTKENTNKIISTANKSNDILKAPLAVNERPTIPQEYIDFMKEKDDSNDIVFYTEEDIDLDGNDEVIIASGEANGSYISSIYILRENDSKIEQLGENLAQGGYAVYAIKLIELKNMPKKYIYCGVTNDASLRGFKIYELVDNQPNVMCYSASATGAGRDELKDFDNDGQFDGYVQNRWSYDVLYYTVSHTYILENNDFVLENTYVELPEYPDNIEDVLIQYMTLRVLNTGKSPEIDKRLSELCIYDKANEMDFSRDVWHTALYESEIQMDNTVKFDIEVKDNTATATAVYVDNNYKKYTHTFHLTKSDNKWCIDNIIR